MPHDAEEANDTLTPAAAAPQGQAQHPFREEFLLRPRTRPDEVAHAVLTVADFASVEECEALMAAADRAKPNAVAKMPGRVRLPTLCERLGRLPTRDDDPELSSIDAILLRRALSLLEQHPALAAKFFNLEVSRSSKLARLRIVFSPGEPAVNIYSAGGEFRPHLDRQHISLLVPLSPVGAFEGGGTAFWDARHSPPRATSTSTRLGATRELQEAAASDDDDDWGERRDWAGADVSVIGDDQPPSANFPPHDYLLRPPAGTLIVFGGDVIHSGVRVDAGTRHIFVASFSLFDDEHDCAHEVARTQAASSSVGSASGTSGHAMGHASEASSNLQIHFPPDSVLPQISISF